MNFKVGKVFVNCLTLAIAICPFQGNAGETLVKSFFSDNVSDKGSTVAFGGRTNISNVTDNEKDRNAVIKIKFDDSTFCGAEIISGNKVDVSKIRKTGALKFFVKGLHGKESFYIGLLDIDSSSNKKTEIKVKSNNYFDVTDKWTQVIIPFSTFSDQGERWFSDLNGGEWSKINWSNIISVKFSADKEQNLGCSDNRLATVFVDNIEIVDGLENMPQPRATAWKLLSDITSGHPDDSTSDNNTLFSFLNRSVGQYTTIYPYGNRTDFSILQSKKEKAVLVSFFDDKEWSGLTLSRAQKKPISILNLRDSGGIEFKVKGAVGGETFSVGLLDDESDGVDRKVQTKVNCKTFVKVLKEWQTVRIPFSAFDDIGRWWNSEAHYEVVGKVDWSKICEIRFSTNQFENVNISTKGEKPVRIYFSDIKLVKKSNVFNNEAYWKNYKSDLGDKLILDFENQNNSKLWSTTLCPNSKMSISRVPESKDKSNAIKLDYYIDSWGSALYQIEDASAQNWTGYNAVKFDCFSREPSQLCMFMFVDGSNEAWCSYYQAKQGWQEVSLPFSSFKQYEFWQPDNVNINGKIDCEKISSVFFYPWVSKKKGQLMIDNISLTNVTIKTEKENILHTNQIGYLSNSVKRFIVSDTIDKEFALFDEQGNMILSDTLIHRGLWISSKQNVKYGDFSAITKPGKYRIVLQESGEKSDIVISDGIYKDLLNASTKAFYYQRLSTPIKPEHAGKWSRISSIPDTACFLHETAGKKGVVNVSGGWMDAGDYGKYIVNGGISVGTLLALYELLPDCIGDTLKIPESRNGISDLLDEVRYELNWMTKMQDKDGGVYFKVGPLSWDGFIMPEKINSQRYVIGKSTTSTLNFAAVMAMASRIYKSDKAFSKLCLDNSLRAWKWAIMNPDITAPSEGGGTGIYGDTHYDDEFFWAASELYITTNKNEFKKYIEENADKNKICAEATWKDLQNLGWFSLVMHAKERKLSLAKVGKDQIVAVADKFVKNVNTIPYRISGESFVWGSNSYRLNEAIVMCYAYLLTKNKKYLDGIVETLDFLFGKNPSLYSFVTGFGTKSPMHIHHRIAEPDGIAEPFPGFLVGGPNAGREDETSGEPGAIYPHKEPARAYVDLTPAYACNEVCINWNAALVFVLGMVNNYVK